MVLSLRVVLLMCCLLFVQSIRKYVVSKRSLLTVSTKWRAHLSLLSTTDSDKDSELGAEEFDSQQFNEALRSLGSVWGKKLKPADELMIDEMRKEQAAQAENIYREYPFANTSLPILPDCNNYYSGKFGDYFWHQNADQVFVYIPINEGTGKRDITVKFEAKNVKVDINGQEEISFECLERIIPDGSFWVIEVDKSGQRYVQLDLEKRFRMINWKSLFGQALEEQVDEIERRSEMLEKLFSANKGMSKLTGAEPETIEDMSNNEELRKMISSEVNTEPTVIDADYGDEDDNKQSGGTPFVIDVEEEKKS